MISIRNTGSYNGLVKRHFKFYKHQTNVMWCFGMSMDFEFESLRLFSDRLMKLVFNGENMAKKRK